MPHHLQILSCVFLTIKDVFLHNHSAEIKIRILTLVQYCRLILGPQSDIASCPIYVQFRVMVTIQLSCLYCSGTVSQPLLVLMTLTLFNTTDRLFYTMSVSLDLPGVFLWLDSGHASLAGMPQKAAMFSHCILPSGIWFWFVPLLTYSAHFHHMV